MKIFSLLQVKYSQFESAVKNYLSKTLSQSGTSYGNNTIFGQLINVLNATVQNIMLYIEDALVEQNKYTAQRKKSIFGLAAQSGYEPSLGKASNVQLAISYSPTNASNLNILIKNHEQLTCTQNGLIYNLILPQEAIVMSLENDNSTRYISAVQGKFEKQTFISNGGKYYTKNVSFLGNLDIEYIEVKINNELWERVDSFYDMQSNSKQYVVKVSPISGIDIIFGNGAHGKPLENEDVIDVTYLVHDGELGNLDTSIETYFVFNNLLQDIAGDEVDGNNVFNVTFSTIDPISSGSNSETIEQVRQMIGYNSRSLVLAHPDNYKRFINQFSFCGYNRTWSDPGSMVVNSLIMKNYKTILNGGKTYFDLIESDFKLSDTQKDSIKSCINNSGQQLAGVIYNIFDPQICKYALFLRIILKKNNYDKEFINSQIRKLIGEFFSDVQSDIFIPKSDIIHLLKNNISEIDGVDLYFMSELNENAKETGSYINTKHIFNPGTNRYEKKQEVIYLYDGENPNLGLDDYGNIFLQNNDQFPVLMGGWDYMFKDENGNKQEVMINDPLIIRYE